MTLYLTDMGSYGRVDEAYKRFFDGPIRPGRRSGVSELLGGASVTLDAVAAIE